MDYTDPYNPRNRDAVAYAATALICLVLFVIGVAVLIVGVVVFDFGSCPYPHTDL